MKTSILILALIASVLGCASEQEFHSVALHELGHVAGFTHSTHSYSIMFPIVHDGKRLSEYDRNKASSIWYADMCFDTSRLPVNLQARFSSAVDEWNVAFYKPWIVSGIDNDCIHLVYLGSNTKGYDAYTYNSWPMKIVFNSQVVWY